MDDVVRKGIIETIKSNMLLLRIPIRQRAKFEGWLKFELAYFLEQKGMENVEVESKASYRRDRTDIVFFHNGEPYSVELTTPNTNWKLDGVSDICRPITKNVQSIIDDVKKLNSRTRNGIVAFALFPIPLGDNRWQFYLDRINDKTGLELSKENNCELIEMNIDEKNVCHVVVCTFMSKQFNPWP
jgi:hypothetical protein